MNVYQISHSYPDQKKKKKGKEIQLDEMEISNNKFSKL